MAKLPPKIPFSIIPTGGSDIRAARFRLHPNAPSAPIRLVTRQRFRAILAVMLVASAIFAIWSWTRPYQFRPDPDARATIVAASLQRDHSYHWLDIRVRIRPDAEHNLSRPIFLKSQNREKIDPADTTLAGVTGRPIDEIFLRFWLEEGDLDGPLTLHLNDGTLSIRNGSGEPRLRRDGSATFNTHRW